MGLVNGITKGLCSPIELEEFLSKPDSALRDGNQNLIERVNFFSSELLQKDEIVVSNEFYAKVAELTTDEKIASSTLIVQIFAKEQTE